MARVNQHPKMHHHGWMNEWCVDMMLFSSGLLIQEEPQRGSFPCVKVKDNSKFKNLTKVQDTYFFPKGTLLHFCKIREMKNGKFCQRRRFQIRRLNLKSSLRIISRSLCLKMSEMHIFMSLLSPNLPKGLWLRLI